MSAPSFSHFFRRDPLPPPPLFRPALAPAPLPFVFHFLTVCSLVFPLSLRKPRPPPPLFRPALAPAPPRRSPLFSKCPPPRFPHFPGENPLPTPSKTLKTCRFSPFHPKTLYSITRFYGIPRKTRVGRCRTNFRYRQNRYSKTRQESETEISGEKAIFLRNSADFESSFKKTTVFSKKHVPKALYTKYCFVVTPRERASRTRAT